MDREELTRKTVAELREIAKGLPDAKGLSSMKKDELVEFVASHGGDSPDPAATKTTARPDATDKTAIKQSIRALKAQKREALSRQDHKAARECNRAIHNYKRLLRKLARSA
jgi:hypothetical protein